MDKNRNLSVISANIVHVLAAWDGKTVAGNMDTRMTYIRSERNEVVCGDFPFDLERLFGSLINHTDFRSPLLPNTKTAVTPHNFSKHCPQENPRQFGRQKRDF